MAEKVAHLVELLTSAATNGDLDGVRRVLSPECVNATNMKGAALSMN